MWALESNYGEGLHQLWLQLRQHDVGAIRSAVGCGGCAAQTLPRMRDRLEAKVCIHCGHRFRTDFAATGQRGADTPSPLAERGRGGEAHSEITEPPIIQAPEAPIELPTQFDAPPRLPDPPVITPSLNSERGQGGEVNPPPPARHATEDLDGEPAPELSDSEFDAMLRNDRKKDRR